MIPAQAAKRTRHGACWDRVRGGDTGRGTSKLVVFLLFFCRLVRTVCTVSARAWLQGLCFFFACGTFFAVVFFSSLSRYIEGGQKEECGSLFSFIPLGRVLFWPCKVLYKALFYLQRCIGCMSVFVSLSESPFGNINFSGCTVHVVRQKEQHVAIFLIDRVNIYNNLCLLRQSRNLTYLFKVRPHYY